MLRGYRRIILAALGCLALASPAWGQANREQRQANQEIANSLSDISASLKEANQRPDPNQPCEKGSDDRNSDLCAQWKAADSAEASSIWTERTFYLGVLGGIIGLLTLGAAAAAAFYARQAALHTESGANEARRAADAAEEGLALANRTNEIQLRAYIRNVSESFTRSEPDSTTLDFKFKFRNVGQTPAKNVVVNIVQYYETHKSAFVAPPQTGGRRSRPVLSGAQFGTVAKETEFSLHIDVVISKTREAQIRARKGFYYFIFRIHYSDEFGVDWVYAHDFYFSQHAMDRSAVHTKLCQTYRIENEGEEEAEQAHSSETEEAGEADEAAAA
jgi:hypothetical protein